MLLQSLAIVRGFFVFGIPISGERHLLKPQLPCRERAEMLSMPDKPDTWAIVFTWLSQHSQTIFAAFLSLCMTVLRVFYTGGTWKDALIEGPMCVLLSLSIIWGFELMGLSPSLAQPVGIWVGFLGVKKVAYWADRIAESKFPQSDSAP
ncbi:phage holin, lambda family [Pseudomonas sp. PDM26]|uniref:phage holin, lambda family n=1 Tax=Pseudomonas sp. PDM26 TaxID=2854766 RepID=UPI003527CC83